MTLREEEQTLTKYRQKLVGTHLDSDSFVHFENLHRLYSWISTRDRLFAKKRVLGITGVVKKLGSTLLRMISFAIHSVLEFLLVIF